MSLNGVSVLFLTRGLVPRLWRRCGRWLAACYGQACVLSVLNLSWSGRGKVTPMTMNFTRMGIAQRNMDSPIVVPMVWVGMHLP